MEKKLHVKSTVTLVSMVTTTFLLCSVLRKIADNYYSRSRNYYLIVNKFASIHLSLSLTVFVLMIRAGIV